jgi:hypothetical protein
VAVCRAFDVNDIWGWAPHRGAKDTYALSNRGIVRVGDPVDTYVVQSITPNRIVLKHSEDEKDVRSVAVGIVEKKDDKARPAQPAYASQPLYTPANSPQTPQQVQPRLMPY